MNTKIDTNQVQVPINPQKKISLSDSSSQWN